MKLRLRHFQGGPTQRLEVQKDCSLRELRVTVASLTGQDEKSVRVSLNKTEELDGPGNLLVSSLGICGGDLLYLLDPRRPDVSQSTGVGVHSAGRTAVPAVTASGGLVSGKPSGLVKAEGTKGDVVKDRRERCAAAAATRQAALVGSDSAIVQQVGGHIADCAGETGHEMDIDKDNAVKETPRKNLAASGLDVSNPGFGTAPSILHKVLSKSGSSVRSGHDLLILATHAVMLDTGFSLVPLGDPDRPLEECWQRSGSRTILTYSLTRNTNPGLTCSLRCQQLGGNLVIYGSCDQEPGAAVYRLNLSVSKHLQSMPPANSWGKLNADPMLGLFKKPRAFSVEVKDTLSVPLLSLLCQLAGASLPASLILLPIDAKNNILAKLPAKDLAAMAATCAELREAASGDEFWKALFAKEFPGERANVRPGKWKEEFRRAWVERKLMRERREEYDRQMHVGQREWRGFRYQPPGMVGGDYDRFPFGGGTGGAPGGFPGGFGGGGMFGLPQGGAFPGGNLGGGFSPNLGPDSLEWPHGGRAHFEAGRGPQGRVGLPGLPGSNLPGFGPGLGGGPSRGGRPGNGRGGFSGSSII